MTAIAAGFRTELDQAGAGATEMKNDLSLHSDNLEKLHGTVQELKTEVEDLKDSLNLRRGTPNVTILELLDFLNQRVKALR